MSKQSPSPSQQVITDELWAVLEPLLPPRPTPKGPGGRPRASDRAALEGIMFVLSTGCRWRDLQPQMGFGSGVTCWRRLRHWQDAGVWERLHRTILDELGQLDAICWERHCIDAVSVRAKKGGELVGRSPVDRGKKGSKYHLLTDSQGIPLNLLLSAGNTHDSKLFEPLLETAPAIKTPGPGRPRRRPRKLHADKGYDNPRCRRYLHRRGIKVRIARRGKDSSQRLGAHRWVVERSVAWLMTFRRLDRRWDRTEKTTTALLTLAAAYTALRFLIKARHQL
ncbi:MAG: IS5 family transposase [Propionibacteriaceae bacterium]|nr:IS5 family transposase [Propionibacteriaceae bacterium]MDO5067964.1 IS5 family transposase [Propionibacteriaceae bacterium]